MKSEPLTADALALQRFAIQHADQDSAMKRDFLQCELVPSHVRAEVALQSSYEFSWGFVAEAGSRGGWMIWNLYVQQVWRDGSKLWWDRFLTAHQNLIAPEMRAQSRGPQAKRFMMTFDDGVTNHCAASYGCTTPSEVGRARDWMTAQLLPRLWSEAMSKALERGHKFERDWYCY